MRRQTIGPSIVAGVDDSMLLLVSCRYEGDICLLFLFTCRDHTYALKFPCDSPLLLLIPDAIWVRKTRPGDNREFRFPSLSYGQIRRRCHPCRRPATTMTSAADKRFIFHGVRRTCDWKKLDLTHKAKNRAEHLAHRTEQAENRTGRACAARDIET